MFLDCFHLWLSVLTCVPVLSESVVFCHGICYVSFMAACEYSSLVLLYFGILFQQLVDFVFIFKNAPFGNWSFLFFLFKGYVIQLV